MHETDVEISDSHLIKWMANSM